MPWLHGGAQPELPFQRAHETSRLAAESAEPTAESMRVAVLDCIRGSGRGATCDEVEERLSMRHQTASARIRELAIRGLIRDSSLRRGTRSGRPAIVWIS
jgi:predicted transcriptional regulator